MDLEIFMPFYGRIDHFKKAVQSVITQSDPEWKLTVVDDVYPDLAAGEWLVSLQDSRITYLRNETNLRPSKNYNKCAALSQSTFTMLMGCDDEMLPDFVSRAKALIADFPQSDVIQPGVEVIDENGKVYLPLSDRVKRWIRPHVSEPVELSGQSLAQSLSRGNWTYFPSILWRTDLIEKYSFRTDLDVVQDLAMLLKIIQAGGTLILDNEVVFRYRRHASSVSSVTGPDGSKFLQEKQLFEESTSTFRELNWTDAAKSSRHHWLSRANALKELPGAILHRNRNGLRNLTRHILNR